MNNTFKLEIQSSPLRNPNNLLKAIKGGKNFFSISHQINIIP